MDEKTTKEFLKEFETELNKLEVSTRPNKSNDMPRGLKQKINNTLSLEGFEPKMKELCKNLLDKHNITEVSDKLNSDIAGIISTVTRNRMTQ